MMGLSLAGYSNSAGLVYGMQCALCGNFVSGIDGVQMLGVLNRASRMRRCQISTGENYTEVGVGVQLSAQVNQAEEIAGVQLGAIDLGGRRCARRREMLYYPQL